MVRARLKPAYARGALTRDGFKEVARLATHAASAATAVAARGSLRTSTRPTFNRRTETVRVYEHQHIQHLR